MQRRTFFLIDAMSCAYRAFFAIPHLRNRAGEPTNAVYGFATVLLKILRQWRPDALAVAFDSPAPTFRHERFREYKAHRKPMPQDLEGQLPLIREFVEAYRFAILQQDGVEADDLMASMAQKAAAAGYDVFCVTNDKDMLQIVQERVFVLKPDGSEPLDRRAVMERYGVEPEKITDVLALAGDESDNVPGVPGIGRKTAVGLIGDFGSLEGVLANIEHISGEKRRESLRTFAEQARLSRELVTLRRDVPLALDPDDCAVREPERNRVSELYRRLDFKRLQAEVLEGEGIVGGSYRLAGDPGSFRNLISLLGGREEISIRIETGGGHPVAAELAGIALSWREGEAWYVPADGALAEGEIIEGLRPVLEDAGVRKVGHDLKRDLLVLERRGVTLRGLCFDTMIGDYLLNPEKSVYGLADLALDYLNIKVTTLSELLGAGKKRIGVRDMAPTTIRGYACQGADVTRRLGEIIRPRLEEAGMGALFREVELPLIEVLAEMEATGVRIDSGVLSGLSAELGEMLDEKERAIYDMAGERFNLNSPLQLGRILFDTLKLPPSRMRKRGYSTDYETLSGLSRSHPLPALLLEYRRLSKLKSTYVDALPRMVNGKTGRIHTSFNQTGTVTGRISSSEPNLQNIPVRTQIGRRIRSAFIPGDEGMVLLSADYSQIDLRIMASLSGDDELVRAFRKGEDVHASTAAAVFSVAPEQVTPELRREGKTINFGIIYGMSAYGLSRELGVNPGDAQGIIDRYFQHYRGVRAYIERSLAEASERGFVTTILNRRRRVPELASGSQSTRELGRRIAINTPIQGSSSDVIKIAMRDIGRELRGGAWRAAMLIQIHDELLFEVDRRQAAEFSAMVKEKMERAWDFPVPLVARIKTGENWGEL